jgi:ABC-type nitrate/sulfonate/bicarbonate transport system permease component
VEGGAAAAALFRVGYGFAGGVVVVAEMLAAEAGAGAAVAVGEDVAALVLLRFLVRLVHVCTPPVGQMCVKSSKEKT